MGPIHLLIQWEICVLDKRLQHESDHLFQEVSSLGMTGAIITPPPHLFREWACAFEIKF